MDILDNGSRGLLGIGGRQSRVRLSVKESQPVPAAATMAGTAVTENKVPEKEMMSGFIEVPASDLTEEDQKSLKVTQDVVRELLGRMYVKASISAKFIEPADENDDRLVLVDIQGNDLSILLGRRSETLNALQYITSLIVSKELNRWVPMMIDVQGYRARRERQLRQLGRRMAQQAVETGKRQILEPMPANERRVIHLELRNNPQVTTESTGEEPFRKVTILPKK